MHPFHPRAVLLGVALATAGGLAAAHPVTYQAQLSNLGEPATAAGSLGTGTATLVFDDDAFSMALTVIFSNLSGNTSASHIHCCTAVPGLGNAGVATPVPTFPGFPLGVTSGSYSQSFDLSLASSWNPAYVTANGGTVSGAFAAFSTGLAAGAAYLNIHTSVSPGGEIRGFLTAVPEPDSMALMLAALGGLGWAGRRRAQAPSSSARA